MTDRIFDTNALLETYRNAFAPAIQAQQEAIKAIERLARYQYAVAGDYLEWSLTQAQAVVSAKSPAELVAKQTELSSKIGEQLRGRVQELTTIASESQNTLTTLFNVASAKVVELTKKAA
ncbi:MAG TPA: phasin family protein [Steroidobacteraceae bacterium]